MDEFSVPTPRWRALIVAVLAAALLLAPTLAGAAPPQDTSGTAPGVELTARWWQVALSSGDFSFWFDPDEHCRVVELPSGPVVMVAGTFGGIAEPRTCVIPVGATIVLPVINIIYALTDPPPADTVGLARQVNRAFIDQATAVATVDGAPLRVQRRRSAAFWVNLSAIGFDTPLRAVSDGYWIDWRPRAGTYEVQTWGTAGDFESGTTYTFEVR
jgi:hypothetical protein